MPVPLVAPENERFPNRIRWTVEECYRLAEAGYLRGRYEVIDGEILSKMGQKPPHRMILKLFASWLISLFGYMYVQEQDPIRIPGEVGHYAEPEPDIAVTKLSTTDYASAHPGPDDLIVVVEIADSSRDFDLGAKALLYARAGVREYWVADVNAMRIHIHRDPDNDGYRWLTRAGIGDVVALETRPEEGVDVGTFFPAPLREQPREAGTADQSH